MADAGSSSNIAQTIGGDSRSKMTEGYVYCLSNPATPGILKVGMTERTPEERVKELYTTGVIYPFKIEFAKKVKNPKDKESTLHVLLEQYTERITSRREFFRVSTEEVRKFFDLMDGEMWCDARVNEMKEEEDDEEYTSSSEDVVRASVPKTKGCRDMKKCFKDGQKIRHVIGINKVWVGAYDSSKNAIVYDEKYMTLNKFAVSHLENEKPDRAPNVNAWKDCECEVDGKWISTYNLPECV